MTIKMRCDDKERLVDYLYAEQGDAERDVVAAHLRECRDCSSEVAALQGVRTQLAEWSAPETDLGFRVVREPVVGPSRSRWVVPAWAALPAAAVLALAVGAAVADVELRYDDRGVTVRIGTGQAPAQTAASSTVAAPPSVPAAMSDEAWRAALADTERRLRAEFTSSARRENRASTDMTDRGEFVRQVQALIAESERRQQRELAIRLAEVVQDVDSQRRADLVQIEENVGQIEGLTAAQRDMMNLLVRVSEGR